VTATMCLDIGLPNYLNAMSKKLAIDDTVSGRAEASRWDPSTGGVVERSCSGAAGEGQ
jgi:hypothetical protein